MKFHQSASAEFLGFRVQLNNKEWPNPMQFEKAGCGLEPSVFPINVENSFVNFSGALEFWVGFGDVLGDTVTISDT